MLFDIHMVSAWASESQLVLGQLVTQEKSNEVTAIPELIKTLELKGCIVIIKVDLINPSIHIFPILIWEIHFGFKFRAE